MEKEDREKLRNLLKEEIDSVEAEIEEMSESTSPISPDNAIGRITRMDAIVNQGVLGSVMDSKKARLTHLLNALAKVDEPGFGICTGCGETIPPVRIQYIPETKTCVDCAS